MKNPPKGYYDGCTCWFDRYGKVSHVDLCNEHDGDWWFRRTALQKVEADCSFCWGLIKRHAKNWPWQPVAFLTAVGALLLFLSPYGWWIWWRK